MKSFLKAVITAFVLSFILTQTIFTAQCEEIPENILRLHILANSDSEEDQNLKIKVRDHILRESTELFENTDNKKEAVHITKTNLKKIVNNAQQYVYSLGYDYKVRGEIVQDMYFNTREYDSYTLPAGRYDAFRIIIGEGEGHNWWCVMFPPMCFSMAEENSDLTQVLTDEQLEITENKPKYEYKLKIVEIYNELKEKL
ncbi:MAG: stage II sporulation protein R [Acutalibacteraceae bacterium]|nr:stage II sporulation protein R [Acutalibacteraceae bacterium]